jgi:DNA-binding MarR family transcriptional regulator/GNAT superfamily N-acetyltransferase
MIPAIPAERIAAVRAFNRMYTKVIGLLDERMLSTPYSLTEVRVMFELAHRDAMPVTQLRRTLSLDPGYLSRLLARFESDGLVSRERSTDDARAQVVALTVAGKDVFTKLDDLSSGQVARLLAGLTDDNQRRLVRAMELIRSQLGDQPRPDTTAEALFPAGGEIALVLRPPRVGDYGWIIHRHGALYAQEQGWDASFESLTARVVADYLDDHDPAREAGWIADLHGEPAGCVFCVRKDAHTAKLRLLLVEPSARGHGVGASLVKECVNFARGAGYRALELWTVDILVAARRIYQHQGFQLVAEEKGEHFGHRLVGQTWRLEL